jgi:cyclic-di-AMP phosphodiesterase PgpH
MAIKSIRRREQVRQLRPDRPTPMWRRLFDRFGPIPLGIGVAFFAAATAIALYGSHTRKLSPGQRTEQPIYAEVDFAVADDQATLRLIAAARAATPSHYRINYDLIDRIRTELQNLYQQAVAAEAFEVFEQTAHANQWQVSEEAYNELRSYAADGANPFEQSINKLRDRLKSEYTWDPKSEEDRTPKSTADHCLVHADDPGSPGQSTGRPKRVGNFDLTPITNTTSLRRIVDDVVTRWANFAPLLRATVSDILVRRMAESPTLVYDGAATIAHMSEQESAVEPQVNSYERDQPIIPRRPDRGLTEQDLQLLAAHDRAYAAFLASDDVAAQPLRDLRMFQRLGLALIILMLTIGLFTYVGTYHPRILEVHTRTIGLVVLVLATMLAARVIDLRSPVKELIHGPVLIAAATLAVAYKRRFAAGVTIFCAMMVVLSVRGDATLLVTMFIGIGTTVYMLGEIRTRERLIWVGAVSACSLFVSSAAFGFIDGQALNFVVIRAGWAALAAVLAAVFLLASLPLIERVFRIATSLTLLEWRDPTRLLLRRLASDAPGTYSHSLLLGTLAESACRAVGANGLLAQVGALYHDIGKLHKAEYFVENQEASINRHDNLAPTMSLLIIVGHVKDGIEMAKEYRLPRVLHQFIAEHHGTTVVRYFHHIASEKQPKIASGKHDREVSESQFRYPGPKPRTKESAILMLCDGIEGAVRALSEPTPGRIEHVVHEIFTDRLNDGQFDDCDITLRELHRVEESLVKSLCSHYHGRVAYPKSRDKAVRAAEGEQEPQHESAAG